MNVDVLLGLQWGDEGKGKIVNLLSQNYDIVARFQGGPNAGHTIYLDDKKLVLHTIPSGITSRDTINIIGNGVVLDPYIFHNEIEKLKNENFTPNSNLLISRRTHIITPLHRLLDAASERLRNQSKIGSTLKGISPAYADKYLRRGIRVGDIENNSFLTKFKKLEEDYSKLINTMGFNMSDFKIENIEYELFVQKWFDSINTLKEFKFIDSEIYINNAISNKKRILAEGAQGTLLDIDFGSYPYVTSSNTTIGGVCIGLGIPPSSISKVFGVFKAYCTRVGNGPFPTELNNEEGEYLRKAGNEYGSTTGRPRRCGWIDIPALKHSVMINGITDLIITKSDVLNELDTIKICKSYSIDGKKHRHLPYDLINPGIIPDFEPVDGWKADISNINSFNNFPEKFKEYIKLFEKELKKPVSIISTGPKKEQTVFRQ